MNVNNAVYEITKIISAYNELMDMIRKCEDRNHKRMLRNILISHYGKYAKHE